MPFVEDMSVFFSTNDHAEEITVKSTTLNAHFSDGHEEEFEIAGSSPRALCITADLPSPLVDGDAVVARSRNFKIRGEPQKDDTEKTTLLILEEQ